MSEPLNPYEVYNLTGERPSSRKAVCRCTNCEREIYAGDKALLICGICICEECAKENTEEVDEQTFVPDDELEKTLEKELGFLQ